MGGMLATQLPPEGMLTWLAAGVRVRSDAGRGCGTACAQPRVRAGAQAGLRQLCAVPQGLHVPLQPNELRHQRSVLWFGYVGMCAFYY